MNLTAILRTSVVLLSIAAGPSALSTYVSAAETVAGQTAALPRVLVLATGGTIAGQADPRASGAYKSGAITGEQLIKSVPGLEKIATLQAEQISSIGSQDMNDKIWFELASRIQKAFDQNETEAVVITHGTDTMEETAFFLQNVLHVDGPVVLVGSMRPSSALSADGPSNLLEAVQVAADVRSRGRGVLTVLNDRIETARSVTKTNTTSVQTFESPNFGPTGYVDSAGGVRFLYPAPGVGKTSYKLSATAPLPRVDIVYSHSNMDADQINDAVARGAKGVVLAGVGDGNTSEAALAALVDAVKKGVIVVRSTRVKSGFVTRNVEVDDDKNGFVVSEDLNPQKARILTQLLIANGVSGPDAIQGAFKATW